MAKKKEPERVLKCVSCREPLQEVKLGPITIPTCVNPECPRLGLLTVVHGDLVERMKKEENGESDDS